MDVLQYFVAGAAILGSILWFFNRKLPAKKDTFKYGVPVPGAARKKGETVPYRRYSAPDKLSTSPDPSIKTIYDVFEFAIKNSPTYPCLGTRPLIKNTHEEKVIQGVKKVFTFPQLGAYQWETYQQVYNRINNFGSGLVKIGLKPKDYLAMFEDTRAEWTIASRAAYTQSITLFTVYANLGEEALVFALNEGKIRFIFTNGQLLKILLKIKKNVESLESIIYTDKADEGMVKSLEDEKLKLYSFAEIEELGKANPVDHNPPKPDDLAAIMYTSGSTGTPKGVMTSHANLVAALSGMAEPVKMFKDTDVFLHYLPLAHSMAFVLENLAFFYGIQVGYGSPRTLSDAGVKNCKGDIQELQPTILVAVPTIYEKIRQGVIQKIKKSPFLTRTLFRIAYNAKLNAFKAGKDTPIWNRIIFNKFKERVGGRVRIMLAGSAPLSPDVHDFIRVCFGSVLIQGYGLTETCSGGSACSVNDIEVSCIGAPLVCSELKLVDIPDMKYLTSDNPPKGEIFIRGGNITLGYYHNDKVTKEAFVGDGWFATGDIGQLLPNGTFKIIDRKKNLIKPPHGEYIALEKLESVYRTSQYVEIICVYADSSHYNTVAVVVPNKHVLIELAQKNGIPHDDYEALCKNEKIRKLVMQDLSKTGASRDLKSIEMLRSIRLCPYEWTPDNEHLTTAMKLNRNKVNAEWKKEIEKMYEEIEASN